MLVMLTSFVVAFAITSPVELIEPQLNLFPGEEKEVFFYAHVSDTEGNNVKIDLIKGSEVLTLIGSDTVTISANTPTKIIFKIKRLVCLQKGKIHIFRKPFHSIKNTQASSPIKGCFIEKTSSIQTCKSDLLHHFVMCIDAVIIGFYLIA